MTDMPPMTGRAIFEGPPIREFFTLGFGTEIMYSFIIIVCSLMIYFGTKELYELSSHKGINYFRKAFLFFALAYFFRSSIKFTLRYFDIGKILDIPIQTYGSLIGTLTLFVFMYFSSMAIFYLLYSVMWKRWNNKPNRIFIFHALALAIAAVTVLSSNSSAHLWINLILFLIVLFVVYTSRAKSKKSKTHQNLYTIYVLLSLFWILNILDVLISDFFQTFQLFIYLASVGIFLAMLYKVLRKTGIK